MSSKIKATEVAKSYRERFPEMPSLKLARIMYEKEQPLFTNVDAARSILRYIEGKSGRKHRKNIKESAFYHPEPRPYNPYKLPDSDEMDYEPFIMNHKRVAILCDIHAPYHNVQALTSAITYCKNEKVDACLINGDLFDFHHLSRFMKDPRKKNFAEELKIGTDIIQVLQNELNCPIYFKLGNHDERYQHFLWQKLGELQGVEDFEFQNLIAKRLPGVTIIQDKRIVKLGDLNCVHGHEFGGSVFSPVNIARGFYLRAKASTIGGHHHRTSEHTEQDINGKIVTTWSVGCLCELHPGYLPINNWNWGVSIVDVDGQDFHVRNLRIYKGRIL